MPTLLGARRTLLAPGYRTYPLTITGGVITDATRRLADQGDGVAPSDQSYGVWPAATNLCTNGGFETDTAGWPLTGLGTNNIESSAEQAKFGSKSGKLTYGDTLDLAYFPLTVDAVAYAQSIWAYIPTSWDGGQITLAATEQNQANFNMALRDQWQSLSNTWTMLAGAKNMLIVRANGGAPTVGRFVYIDGAQIETGSVATPYIETDGGTAASVAGRIQVPNPLSYFTGTEGAVAVRIRMGYAHTLRTSYFFHLALDANNRVVVYHDGTGNVYTYRVAGGAANQFGPAVTWAAGDEITVIGKWTATTLGASVNGAPFVSGADAHLPLPTSLDIGSGGVVAANQEIASTILGVILFRSGQLTNADSAAINAIMRAKRGALRPRDLPGDCSGVIRGSSGVVIGR